MPEQAGHALRSGCPAPVLRASTLSPYPRPGEQPDGRPGDDPRQRHDPSSPLAGQMLPDLSTMHHAARPGLCAGRTMGTETSSMAQSWTYPARETVAPERCRCQRPQVGYESRPGPLGRVRVLAVRQVACGQPQERPVVLLPGGRLVRAVQVGRVGAVRDGDALRVPRGRGSQAGRRSGPGRRRRGSSRASLASSISSSIVIAGHRLPSRVRRSARWPARARERPGRLRPGAGGWRSAASHPPR